MPLLFEINDITTMRVDAIVNAANNSLLGGGGVDGAIHAAAGPDLLKECMGIGGLSTGKAVATLGYRLPAKHVIHTVGPVYRDGLHGEEALLRSAYRESLRVALELNCETLAFPLISGGVYGYPKQAAAQVAVSEIQSFLADHDMTVYLVFYNRRDFDESRPAAREQAPDKSQNTFARLHAYMERVLLKNRVDEKIKPDCCEEVLDYEKPEYGETVRDYEKPKRPRPENRPRKTSRREDGYPGMLNALTFTPKQAIGFMSQPVPEPKFNLDESFRDMLFRLIDEKGLSDAECYKKANVDRRTFSKLRNGDRTPKKITVLAFCAALELSLDVAEDLLSKAGFALSDAFLLDVIGKWCLENRIFDVYEINQYLLRYDQEQLGVRDRD